MNIKISEMKTVQLKIIEVLKKRFNNLSATELITLSLDIMIAISDEVIT